jgi:hypothetical protein
MDYIERKAAKLLAQSAAVVSRMVAETLCDVPQRELVRLLLEELRGNLDEFEEAYFGASPAPDAEA